MKPTFCMIIISIVFIGCDHEEEVIEKLPENWDNIILGEYLGGLEIFYGDDSLYMEKITATLDKIDDSYAIILDSKAKLKLESINIKILSIENYEDKNDVVNIEMIENPFYETKEVGSYFNTIYINNIIYSQIEGPCIEIRLSLICLYHTNVSHIFIRAKKFL